MNHQQPTYSKHLWPYQDTVPWFEVAKALEEQLKPIKIFLLDVDGILTTSHIAYMGEETGFARTFHTLDGYAFKFLKKAGIQVGIISGGNSIGLIKRMEDLQPHFFYYGKEDKRSAYEEIKKKTKASDQEILYMGDDLFDIPLLKKAGFSATVPSASFDVKDCVHYVTHREAGMGCMREVADLLRIVQNIPYFFEDFDQ
jgi:3-deoxy-D-manno-octulosonate 8-phosphate phosphatase (KDO 8-P phosphatase)